MNLTVDIGNSRLKLSVFDDDREYASFVFDDSYKENVDAVLTKYPIDAAILSSVASYDTELVEWMRSRIAVVIDLCYETPVPIKNDYLTPKTLGMDRLAAVVGARHIKPDVPLLVIDAGSAITYDFMSADGCYKGGNIAPGAVMRLRALHDYTERLPIVDLYSPDCPTLIGNTTKSAILGGVVNGIIYEIEGYVASLREGNSNLTIFLTGGDSIFFEKQIKSSIFVVSNLTAVGLNDILNYNLKK